MARVLLLLSSANQLKLADGSLIEAGGFSAPESLAAYEQLTAGGE